MSKKVLLCVLTALLIYLIFNRYVLQFVWVNPNVKTSVLPHISKSIKELDNALNHSVLAMKSSQLDIQIIYKNAYGSGFLKNNPIPNDLDYSIGVYLGEYEYDGKNSYEIAKSIDEKMTVFQTEFYSYINTIAPGKFYSDYDVLTSIQSLFNKRENNINSISRSIPKLFEHKDYIVYTNKTVYNENQQAIQMLFPFVLKKNEILIEDYSPIELFTNLVKYDKNTRGMLREITIVTDFYVDIKKGTDIVNAEIVAESFTGQRLQLTRRFFVPVVFVGNSSANYLKHLNLLTNDDDYLEYRLFNFKRHLQEFSNLKELQERPIKLFKRVLQCTDLILPVLDKNTTQDITNTIEENLNNPNIQLVNDYQTAFGNIIQITTMPNLWLKAQYNNNQITRHINTMKQIVAEMKNSDGFNKAEIEELEKFTNNLAERAKLINSEFRLKDFYKTTMKEAGPIANILDKIVNDNTKDKEKILSYIDTFYKIMTMAGFHKIEMCWLDKNLLGIVKDDFTSKIPEDELKKMAAENKLADVNYTFIDRSVLSGPKVRYSVWVRYNASEKENETWENMKKQLLDDKQNFKLKREFTFSF